jgi:flagellar M-ring protein FliF
MAQAPGQTLTALARGFSNLGNTQKIGLLAAAAAVVAIVVVTVLWARTPEYRVLYSNISDHDGGEVIGALSQQNIPYKLSEGGSVILVPASQVYDTRLKLASQGLPKGGAVGFEIMDSQKFGTSQFAEQVNYQRALAGELARTIQSFASVQSARVHLAIPRPSVFVREAQQPSASVLVSMYQGRVLDPAQVNAIQHLVASGIPELTPRNVTVVDQAGNLLSSPDAGPVTNGLDAAQLKYLHDVELSYAARIENILKPIVGVENVRAQVTAALDFNQVEQTSETFTPNPTPQDAAVRSHQSVETITINPQQGQSGSATGPIANRPSDSAGQPIATLPPLSEKPAQEGGRKPTVRPTANTHKENIINYEVDKTVRHTKVEVGTVKRLSAAVVVNYKRGAEKDGKSVYAPLSDVELAQIDTLARDAMGFSKERGDTLNIVNAPFSGEPVPSVAPPQRGFGLWLDDFVSPAGVSKAATYLVAIALIAFLLFGLVLPVVRNLKRAGHTSLAGASVPVQAPPSPTGYAPAREADFEADLQAVKDLARQRPRIVANVVKEWVGRDE